MPRHIAMTERILAFRGADELRQMRAAECFAYLQGAVGVAVGLSAIIRDDRTLWSDLTISMSVMTIALGYALGRRHRAMAAAMLMVLVVVECILRLVITKRMPGIIFYGPLLLVYAVAVDAAREYATFRDAIAGPTLPSAASRMWKRIQSHRR